MSDRLVNPSEKSKKLSVLWAIAGISLISLIVSLVVFWGGYIGGAITILLVLAPVLIFFIIRYPKFGIIFYLILAYWIMFLLSLGVNFPLGTVMDGLLVLLFLAFFINQKKRPNWEIFKNPISIIILIWISYNIIQVANPSAESRLAWLYTIRGVAGVMLSYFIFSYFIDSVKLIRLIIKIWLTLSVIAALYAIKQEYFGFFPFEQRALDADPLLQSLLFIDGHWRKSAIFSDPVAFSYNMIVSSILCIVLIFGPTKKWQKIVLGIMAFTFLNVMLYSGTRAAYVLLPAAMVLFAILKLNRQILIFMLGFGFVMAVMVYMPTSNPTLYRFQSAFRPSDDASYGVRAANQKRIQPYIKSHPFGGGLGATGVWGVRFAPYSFLASFPPDSGYVRVAVELGWVGLFLICALMFIVVRTGINNYFIIRDPELKNYCLAMILIMFAMAIANFPQEAIVQYPLSIYVFLVIALINVTLRLDQGNSKYRIEKDNGIEG